LFQVYFLTRARLGSLYYFLLSILCHLLNYNCYFWWLPILLLIIKILPRSCRFIKILGCFHRSFLKVAAPFSFFMEFLSSQCCRNHIFIITLNQWCKTAIRIIYTIIPLDITLRLQWILVTLCSFVIIPNCSIILRITSKRVHRQSPLTSWFDKILQLWSCFIRVFVVRAQSISWTSHCFLALTTWWLST